MGALPTGAALMPRPGMVPQVGLEYPGHSGWVRVKSDDPLTLALRHAVYGEIGVSFFEMDAHPDSVARVVRYAVRAHNWERQCKST